MQSRIQGAIRRRDVGKRIRQISQVLLLQSADFFLLLSLPRQHTDASNAASLSEIA